MKTINQLATERVNALNYPRNKEGFRIMIHQAVASGVAIAQRWIPVEEELPEIKKNNWVLIVLKNHPFKKYQTWEIKNNSDIEILLNVASHWRPIEYI